MNSHPGKGLQEPFLNDVRKRRQHVLIYLVNGVKQHGVIESFDQHTVRLRTSSSLELIYKHTIASVMPRAKPLSAEKDRTVAAVQREARPAPSTTIIVRKSPRRFTPES